jgi:hypothetical protein
VYGVVCLCGLRFCFGVISGFFCFFFFFILREFSDGFLSCFDFLVSSFCLLVVKYGVVVVVAFHVSLLRLMCLPTCLRGERYMDSQTQRERERM